MKHWIELSEGKLKKPILRVGEFKKQSNGEVFTFEQKHIDFFCDSFSGKIPVPLEHTTDPEKNRGWITGMEKEEEVLFGIFELEGVEHPNRFDTSVNIPIEEGRVQPIDHVALTSYPVVDGLGKFEEIACSLVPKVEEKTVAVDWKKLGAALSLSDELTDANAVETLTGHFIALSEKAKPVKVDKVIIPPKLLKLAKYGRIAKIESLPLSKGAQDKLVAVFCTDDALSLSLGEEAQDNFDVVIEAIEAHESLQEGEVTGVQLSDSRKKPEEEFIVQDAKRRAEAAKGAK